MLPDFTEDVGGLYFRNMFRSTNVPIAYLRIYCLDTTASKRAYYLPCCNSDGPTRFQMLMHITLMLLHRPSLADGRLNAC